MYKREQANHWVHNQPLNQLLNTQHLGQKQHQGQNQSKIRIDRIVKNSSSCESDPNKRSRRPTWIYIRSLQLLPGHQEVCFLALDIHAAWYHKGNQSSQPPNLFLLLIGIDSKPIPASPVRRAGLPFLNQFLPLLSQFKIGSACSPCRRQARVCMVLDDHDASKRSIELSSCSLVKSMRRMPSWRNMATIKETGRSLLGYAGDDPRWGKRLD